MDNFKGVLPDSIVAVNLSGNYKPPHLAKFIKVTETFFNVQWLKGSYKRSGCLGVAGLQLKFQRKVSFTLIIN